MKSQVIAESEKLVQNGIAAQNQHYFDDAGMLFWRALTCLRALADATSQRDQTRGLASLFRRGAHEDLALLAIADAIRLDEQLMDHDTLASDLMFYGNVHQRLGNNAEARATFEDVIKRCVARKNFGDAASASTNLAMLVANGGDGDQAITLLKHSLEYLAKKELPDTEFITHMTLIQVVGLHDGDPALAVNSAMTLSQKFPERLTEELRGVLIPLLRKAVEKYLKKKPVPNPSAWKNENLPWVYSDGPGDV
jgi:tetratricopeptide (TPR) repeat protein